MNASGLDQRDTNVWKTRLAELCPIADDDQALEELGERYLEEDASLSVRNPDAIPMAVVSALQLIASSACD